MRYTNPFERRPILKSKAPVVKWIKEWVPQDIVATGGKCYLRKYVTCLGGLVREKEVLGKNIKSSTVLKTCISLISVIFHVEPQRCFPLLQALIFRLYSKVKEGF